MILTCPECATRYFVPDESLGPAGRRVRCHACGHTWRAAAETPLDLVPPAAETSDAALAEFARRPEAAADLSAPELPRAFRARAEQQRRLRRAAAHGAVWAGIGAAFVGLVAAGWLMRVDIVRTFPRAAAAYAAIGAPVNATGLEFEAVSARAAPNDPGSVLVAGAVRNVDRRAAAIPAVRVSLLNERGGRVASRVIAVQPDTLAPGAVQGFAVILPDPLAQAADVGVTFDFEAAPAPAPAPAAPAAENIDAEAPTGTASEQPSPLRPALGPPQPAPVEATPAPPNRLALHAAADSAPRHG